MEKLENTIKAIRGINKEIMIKTQSRLDNLTKPKGSLGRLEELAILISGIQVKENPCLDKKIIFTLAADHGVSDEGVSAFPKEVTAQMVYNFISGGAGINVLSKHVGAKVIVVDMGVACDLQVVCGGNFKDKKINHGTKNLLKEPDMTRDEAVACSEAGIEVFNEENLGGIDIVGVGEMGISNTTASSAITSVITANPVEDVTGRGTGIDNKALNHKIDVINGAIEINNPDPCDAIDVLAKVGGFEIGGLAGVILTAASNRVPVVIDGFISAAAALIAYSLNPLVKDYMIAAHSSVERGHKIILDYIGIKPLFDFGFRLGEGTGAALAMGIAQASINILSDMATFESASVSRKEAI